MLPGLEQNILGSLTAQASIFGWILSGPILNDIHLRPSLSSHTSVLTDSLHEDLVRFWQLEESPVQL